MKNLLIDSSYRAKRLWKTVWRQGWDVAGGLKCNRIIRLIEPDGT